MTMNTFKQSQLAVSTTPAGKQNAARRVTRDTHVILKGGETKIC